MITETQTLYSSTTEQEGSSMNRNEVYRLIDGERQYQQEMGQPDEHYTGEWLDIMGYYMNQAWEGVGGGEPDRLASIRKVIAVGVACLEQHGCPPREGYEPEALSNDDEEEPGYLGTVDWKGWKVDLYQEQDDDE